MFKQNEGIVDRLVRLGLAAVLLPVGLLLLGGLQGTLAGLVVTGVGTIALFTGITGFCLLYIPFGFSTLEKERQFVARFRSMAASCGPRGMRSGAGMCGPFRQSDGSAGTEPSQGVRV